jgi:hypothetical protein
MSERVWIDEHGPFAPRLMRAKPLEWDEQSTSEWSDKHCGFFILFDAVDEPDTPYRASWGEGDTEAFATLAEAKRWCQQEIDRWVERIAVGVELTDAARDALAERRRQVDVEGWNAAHDDEHDDGSLAAAASAYALAAADKLQPMSQGDGGYDDTPPPMWCWATSWWKPGPPRRMLVKAAALILAEIERLDRAGPRA